MHILFDRPAFMFCVWSATVCPGHSDTLPSDRVLVPTACPFASTFHGVTPPFLLHMTSQSVFGLTPVCCVFQTGSASFVRPSLLMIVCDAYLATPRCVPWCPCHHSVFSAVKILPCSACDEPAYLVSEQIVKLCGILPSGKSSLSKVLPRMNGIALLAPASRMDKPWIPPC